MTEEMTNTTKKTILDLNIGEVGYVKSFDNLDCACKLLTLGLYSF